jgi:hypothetical protein
MMMMKKVFVLIVCMTAWGAALFAQTASDFETRPEGNGVVITKYKGQGGAVTIPTAIGGKPVIGWSRAAFNGNRRLTSVTIPEGFTYIGDYSFGDSGLTSVTIPTSVTYIGKSAFLRSGLTSVTIPASVTSIDEGAFDLCPLTSIMLLEGVTNIGDNAFRNCTRLTTVTIPASVKSIGKAAFYGCTSLTAINVSPTNQHYKDIDGVLFTKDGKTLHSYPVGERKTAYTIPAGVISIGNGAFSKCKNLTSITIPVGVTSIGERAFESLSNLTSITIPEGVTSIGENAFSDCSSLEFITIPTSITRIGKGAFSYSYYRMDNATRDAIEKRFGEEVFW